MNEKKINVGLVLLHFFILLIFVALPISFLEDWVASTGGHRSYGNKNGQGVMTNLITFNSEISYSLKNFDFFVSLYYRKKDSDLLNQNEVWYSVGLRTFPFSAFPDY